MTTSVPASMPGGRAVSLHSQRFVTTGYRNVFARAFLYGMGLSDRDMGQPFVGLALAHNEAAPGQASVRAVGDLLKRRLPGAGLTERTFVVPDTVDDGETAIDSRELVADSAELVVRGHWYDALIGVATSGASAFGLAQAILRLRIPGWVAIPADRVAADPTTRMTAEVLGAVGLARVVDVNDPSGLIADAQRLATDVRAGEHAGVVSADSFVAGLVPEAFEPVVLPHVAALAHELGLADLASLAAGPAAQVFGLRCGERTVTAIGSSGIAPGSGDLVQGDEGSWRIERHGQTAAVVLTDGAPDRRSGPALVLAGLRAPGEALGLSDGTRTAVELTVDGPVGTEALLVSNARLSGCMGPGLIDSDLNYDRFAG